MPIRREAAEKLARDLFGTFIRHGLVHEDTLQATADIIQSAVNIDETEVWLETLRKRLAESA